MMCRSTMLLGTLCLFPVLTTLADDAAPPRSDSVKAPRSSIALIDMAEAFKGNQRFQRWTEELKERVAEVTAQMKTMAAMEKGLKEGLEKATTVEERKRLEKDILKVSAELQVLKTSTQVNLAREEAAIYRRVYKEVQSVVATIARERGYTMVLRYSSEEIAENEAPQVVIQKLNQLVVFSEPERDITEEVIERLNARKSEP